MFSDHHEIYLKSLGNKLTDKATGSTAYWNIMNNLLNKYKILSLTKLLLIVRKRLNSSMIIL